MAAWWKRFCSMSRALTGEARSGLTYVARERSYGIFRIEYESSMQVFRSASPRVGIGQEA